MTTVANKEPRTIVVPVTTMEEIPDLSAEQKAELIASLADAEREIAEGRGAPYSGEEMRARFKSGFLGAKTRTA